MAPPKRSEPVVVVSLRLPESVVAAIDERAALRGLPRATYLVRVLTRNYSPAGKARTRARSGAVG